MNDRPAAPRRARKPAAPTLAPATISEADGVRYLHLGTPWVQGAMRIRKPAALELEYIQRMMAWLLLRPEADHAPVALRGHAVQLGLGAAAITRFCHTVLRLRCTAVELNPSVVTACRLWFHLPDDSARLQVIEADAADYAADRAHAGSADVLCVDLYDHDAAGPVHDGDAFYRDCHALLADGGVMSVNLFGRHASFERSAARIAAAFGPAQVLQLRPTKEGNTIVLAIKGAAIVPRERLAVRAQHLETRLGLPAKKWLKMLRALPATIPAPTDEPLPRPADETR